MSDLIVYKEPISASTVSLQEGTIPPGEIYCKECITDGSSSVLHQYFARCHEMRRHYGSSRDYVLSLLERHMMDHPVGNTVDLEDEEGCVDGVDHLNEYEREVGLKLPPRSELWYVEEMNEMAKRNPFDTTDGGGLDTLVSDQWEEKDAWSVADFLIGKPVRLYCNLDNEYHNGRIIDWRTCSVYANDNMPQPCKNKRKSIPIGKLDYYGSGPISSCEFLVRFPAGEGRRQKEVLQWILLEEHSLAVGITLVRARFDIKSNSQDKWRPAMVLARSALELVPVREFLQEGVNGELFGQKKLEEAERGVSSTDDLLALTSFFGGKDHEILNLNNEAKGLITLEVLEKYNVDKELAGESPEKGNHDAASPTGVTGANEPDAVTSGKRRLSIPVPPKMALALAEYKEEYRCKEEYKILSTTYSDQVASKPADERPLEVKEIDTEDPLQTDEIEAKLASSLTGEEVKPSPESNPYAASSLDDDDMMDASLTETEKKHDNNAEYQSTETETINPASEVEQKPKNMEASAEKPLNPTDKAETDKGLIIENDNAGTSFRQAESETILESSDANILEEKSVDETAVTGTVVSPNKMENEQEESGDAKKRDMIPSLGIDVEEEYDEGIYADYDIIEVYEDDESMSDDAVSVDSEAESIESVSRQSTFSQNDDLHDIQSYRLGRNRYSNFTKPSERGQNDHADYGRRRASVDSAHVGRSRRMSETSEPQSVSVFQEKSESRKRPPPQSRPQPEAKKSSLDPPAPKAKPAPKKPAPKPAPKKPAPKPAESSSDDEDANAKLNSGILAVLPRGITMRPSGKWVSVLFILLLHYPVYALQA